MLSQANTVQVHESAQAQPPRDPRAMAMAVSGVLAVVLGAAALMLPAPYVVESPGPTFNTIGEVNNEPLIQIDGHESFETSGDLSLTTVYVAGGPNGRITVFDAFRAWMDPNQSVVPVELVYPPGTTEAEVQEQNTLAMTSSQESAIAAALGQQGIDYSQELSVVGFTEDSASEGRLRENDVILRVNGAEVSGLDFLREELNAGGGETVQITVRRDGAEVTEEVTPRQSDDDTYQLGVMLATDFEFPFDVQIELDRVGGPSAGLMFALGIVDKLTPGELTGGDRFAGTGTIDSAGEVGPIGGIAQKMVGAHNAGAEYFLAPAGNCNEVVGNVPAGLEVFKVETLQEAITAVETAGSGGDTSSLPRCSAA